MSATDGDYTIGEQDLVVAANDDEHIIHTNELTSYEKEQLNACVISNTTTFLGHICNELSSSGFDSAKIVNLLSSFTKSIHDLTDDFIPVTLYDNGNGELINGFDEQMYEIEVCTNNLIAAVSIQYSCSNILRCELDIHAAEYVYQASLCFGRTCH